MGLSEESFSESSILIEIVPLSSPEPIYRVLYPTDVCVSPVKKARIHSKFFNGMVEDGGG